MQDTMESLHEAIKNHGNLEDEQIKEAARYGADGGWGGFTSYCDCIEFYDKNEIDIWKILENMADSLGESPLQLIAGFGCAGTIRDVRTFKGALSWFALEEVGRWLEAKQDTGTE